MKVEALPGSTYYVVMVESKEILSAFQTSEVVDFSLSPWGF